MWELLNQPVDNKTFLFAVAIFFVLWLAQGLENRSVSKRIDEIEGFASRNSRDTRKWVADTFAFKNIEKMNADTIYAAIEHLQAELKELNAYAERNIKRIDDNVSGLDTEVELLDDAVIAVRVDVERMATPAWKRWLRGVVA